VCLKVFLCSLKLNDLHLSNPLACCCFLRDPLHLEKNVRVISLDKGSTTRGRGDSPRLPAAAVVPGRFKMQLQLCVRFDVALQLAAAATLRAARVSGSSVRNGRNARLSLSSLVAAAATRRLSQQLKRHTL